MSGYSVAGSLVLLLFAAVSLRADATNFSGHWQLQPDKSQRSDEQTVSLDIQQDGDKVTVNRVYRDGGREVSARFNCTTDASQCTFDDGGHKATVSLWYDGADLVLLKTNGDKRDSTVEWHLHLGNDGKTLSVSREIMEPTDRTINLVFGKTESLAAR